ncbi:MAG: response regulator [Terriglobales bacterium]
MLTVRVLVVDDYEPFRRFIRSTLGRKAELQIVGETSDGLEAVHKAEELQPDLIVLDIGLPTLNGIEAARRIRVLSPKSKILFVSQESSGDVVQEALGLGLGYVVKAHAGRELLSALETVLEDGQFISSGLSGQYFTAGLGSKAFDRLRRYEPLLSLVPGNAEITRGHEVEFYPDDAAFAVGFASFIEATLEAEKAVIVVATESHCQSVLQKLQEHGVDINAAIELGRYLTLDVGDTLSSFMANELPDPVRFLRVVGDLISEAAQGTAGDASRVAICGESASILWAQGRADAAIHVEQLCSKVAKRYKINILCGFSLSSFYREEDKQLFQKICSE